MKSKHKKKSSGFYFGYTDGSAYRINQLIHGKKKSAKIELIFLNNSTLHIFINKISELEEEIRYTFEGVIATGGKKISGRINIIKKGGRVHGLPSKLASHLGLRRLSGKQLESIRYM